MTIQYTGHDFILHGNALDRIKQLPSESVNCIVTSPPYYGLRDYGVSGQIGLEESTEQYIEKLVTLFRECRRALKDTGTFWLNLGDSYATQGGNRKGTGLDIGKNGVQLGGNRPKGYKDKDLMMIPARVALALQADGWYLRSAIVWHKPNCMPESVKDRPTNDYEMVYLLSKSPEYYYDADSLREPNKTENNVRNREQEAWANNAARTPLGGGTRDWNNPLGRNKRAVWSINTKPYSEAHFATMPQELADNCVKAGCPKGGIVLDPFGGAGTTAISAIGLKRHYVLIELNPSYIALAQKRIRLARIEASQLELFTEAAYQ